MNNKIKYSLLLLMCFSLFESTVVNAWGFWAHKRINKIAVFTLPTELMGFFKENIDYVTNHAVDPDKRRYAVEGEAPKHYIDIDHYCNFPHDCVPKNWDDAVETFSEDTLQAYGTSPWNLEKYYYTMVNAFESKDPKWILKVCTDFGHYLGDLHVPLHTTVNYNGQLSNQHGIHAFWESRIPELMGDDYDYFMGKAVYIDNIKEKIWNIVMESSAAVDTVLNFEQTLTDEFPTDKKYSFDDRNETHMRAHSKEFSLEYNLRIKNMVYKRMSASIVNLGSFWYTAWVNAGKPDLSEFSKIEYSQEDLEEMKKLEEQYKSREIKSRDHWE